MSQSPFFNDFLWTNQDSRLGPPYFYPKGAKMKDLSKSVQIAQVWIRDLDPYFLAQRKKQEGLTKSVQIVRLGVLGSELLFLTRKAKTRRNCRKCLNEKQYFGKTRDKNSVLGSGMGKNISGGHAKYPNCAIWYAWFGPPIFRPKRKTRRICQKSQNCTTRDALFGPPIFSPKGKTRRICQNRHFLVGKGSPSRMLFAWPTLSHFRVLRSIFLSD